LRVVFLGALIPRKAPHLLLKALAAQDEGQAMAYFVGSSDADPGYARGLQQMRLVLRLQKRAHFTGYLAPAQLAALLAESQVLVLPSGYEGFGIAYLEGMAYGLPAIGTTAGAAGDLIRDGHNGFLIAPDDYLALAEVLTDLHHNRQRLAAMGIAARRRFGEHPGWEESMSTARQFLEGYNRSIA
jgi:glycosyltransferase involved in cell wall biosynthesis